MNLLLSEALPLRTTRMLGDFSDDRVLPKRLGDLRAKPFELIKLTASTWFAADHPMQITGVSVAGEPTVSFEASLETDEVNTWTTVRLGTPAEDDDVVTAVGIGLLNPATGELIENPAELMEFVLRLAGRSAIFPQLRAEAAAAGLAMAGSIDRVQSIRAWLDEIAYSAGAIWTQETARLYPRLYVAGASGPVLSLDKLAASEVTASASLHDTCDILRVSYDVNEATGKAQHYIELTASPQRFGGISAEVVLRWLTKPSNAESVGRRLLQRRAGERYNVTYSTNKTQVRPCTWSELVANPQWPIPGPDPVAMVLVADIEPDTKTARVSHAEYIASTPLIAVTAHSVALPPDAGGGLAVTYANGVATFTITDNNGQPIKAALVSLDGSPPKTTDAKGQVAFVTPRGLHTIAVEAAGFTPFEMEIEI